jgi:hypothetical protein
VSTRVVFTGYLVLIISGVLYGIVLGLLQQ